MKSSSVALIVAVLALIVGGGLYFYSEEEDLSDQKIYDDGIDYTEEGTSSVSDNGDEVIMASPEKASLAQVAEVEGSAIANRVYSGGEFIHTIVAQLPALDEGFYECWLVNNQNEFFLTGKMEESDGNFYLEYRADNDQSSYGQVVVTLEQEDDGLPEKHILEGAF